jgi:hypothetical protein
MTSSPRYLRKMRRIRKNAKKFPCGSGGGIIYATKSKMQYKKLPSRLLNQKDGCAGCLDGDLALFCETNLQLFITYNIIYLEKRIHPEKISRVYSFKSITNTKLFFSYLNDKLKNQILFLCQPQAHYWRNLRFRL